MQLILDICFPKNTIGIWVCLKMAKRTCEEMYYQQDFMGLLGDIVTLCCVVIGIKEHKGNPQNKCITGHYYVRLGTVFVREDLIGMLTSQDVGFIPA